MILSICPATESQKLIQLEIRNRVHSKKIEIGETFFFQTHELAKIWQEGTVVDIFVDDGVIEFTNQLLAINQIRAMRFEQPKSDFLSSKLPAGLIGFSYAWGFWTAVALLDDPDTVTTNTILVPVISYSVGRLLKALFGKRTYRLGKRKNIRLIDLTFYPE